jgi:hypothetical protein
LWGNLRRQRCEQLGLLPHSGGLQERCAALRMKVLPGSDRCRRRRRPWVSFYLLGGVAEVCWHFSRSVWKLSPGRKPRSGLDRRDGGVLDVVPLLGASRSGTWWRSYVALLRCLSPFKVGHRMRYARQNGRVQGDDFLGPTKFRHLLL